MNESAEEQIITSITPQQRRRGRFSVFVNDEFVIGLDEGSLAALGWRVGDRLKANEIERAREEVEYRAARASAEMLLGYRSRSENEIVKRLEDKGYSPIAIDHALRYLKQQGYINDREYASRVAESGVARGLGRKRLAADLRRRGVDNELAEAALQSIDENSEKKLALEFAKRRAASMVHLDPVVKARRLAAMLERRGFPYSAIQAALQQLVEQEEPESWS